MFRLARSARRFARLGTLTVLVCVAWMPLHGPIVSGNGDLLNRPKVAASVWAAALPSELTPLTAPPNWQFVSMIADDIDADGDLDVVANDGSLDLIVWINDGTGRLSRQDNHKPRGWPQKMSEPGLSDQGVESPAVAHVPSSVLQTDSSLASRLTNQWRSRWTGSPDALLPFCVSARSPRGPPLSRLAS